MLVKASELLKKGTKFNITNFQKSRTAGIIEVAKASTRDLYNFMDFLEGGLKIDLTIMIDFGNGNGEKLSENYLHKIREDKLNCYQQLI